MLAPTDDAIADSLGKQGLSFSDLVANPTLSLMVLQFHLLPNPIQGGGLGSVLRASRASGVEGCVKEGR